MSEETADADSPSGEGDTDVGETAEADTGTGQTDKANSDADETVEGDEDETVDTDTVDHVATLARIDIDDDERERFAEQFVDILAAFETLDAVPAVEDEPDLTNVMRTDEIEPSLDRTEALQNAPETEDGYFKGPRVS